MPNEVNKLFRGINAGALGLAQGIFDRKDRVDSDNLYNSAVKSLQSMLDQYSNQTGEEQDPEVPNTAKVESYQTQGRRGPVTGITKSPMKVSDIMNKYYDVEANLSANFGDYGKAKANSLAHRFGSMLQSPDYQYMQLPDGTIATINKLTNEISYKTYPYFKPKEQKKKLTASEYANLTEEGASQLDISDIENGFYYMNPELQDILKKKYPILQQMYDKDFKEGDFQPKLSRSRLRRSSVSSQPYSLKETERQKSLSEIYKNNANWDSLSDTDKDNFVKAKQEMADSMGITQDELNKRAEEYANARGDKQRKEIVRRTIEEQEEVTQSADDIFSQIIGNDFIHNMYMIDTATEEGLNNLIAQEKAIWKSIGDNWNAIDERIIKNVQQKALNEMNAVRRSKKLPPLTLQ